MNGFIKGGGYPDGMAGAARNTFSWATDLGSGAMNAYSFYLYGSPFFWLSLIFPQNWLPYLMAVSYTHLDVYKRQIWTCLIYDYSPIKIELQSLI